MQDPGIRRAQGSPPGPVTIHPRMSTLPSGAPSPLPTSPLQDPASHRSVDATAPHPAPCAANMFLRAEVANTWKYRGKALQTGLESLTLHSVPSPRHVLSCGAHGGPSFWRGTGRKPAGRACPSRQPFFLTCASPVSRPRPRSPCPALSALLPSGVRLQARAGSTPDSHSSAGGLTRQDAGGDRWLEVLIGVWRRREGTVTCSTSWPAWKIEKPQSLPSAAPTSDGF